MQHAQTRHLFSLATLLAGAALGTLPALAQEAKPVELRYAAGLRYPRFVKVGRGKGPLDRLLERR